MFETALQAKLVGDGQLAAYLSKYQGFAAVFSEFAPDAVETPFLTYRITSVAADHPTVETFSVMLDYYCRDVSRADSRKAVDRIKNLLDFCDLSSDRYDTIRLFYYSGGPAVAEDPRDIHYNLQFEARAGRKSWAATL